MTQTNVLWIGQCGVFFVHTNALLNFYIKSQSLHIDEVPLLAMPPKFQSPFLLLFASNLEYSKIHISLSVLTLFQGLKVWETEDSF